MDAFCEPVHYGSGKTSKSSTIANSMKIDMAAFLAHCDFLRRAARGDSDYEHLFHAADPSSSPCHVACCAMGHSCPGRVRQHSAVGESRHRIQWYIPLVNRPEPCLSLCTRARGAGLGRSQRSEARPHLIRRMGARPSRRQKGIGVERSVRHEARTFGLRLPDRPLRQLADLAAHRVDARPLVPHNEALLWIAAAPEQDPCRVEQRLSARRQDHRTIGQRGDKQAVALRLLLTMIVTASAASISPISMRMFIMLLPLRAKLHSGLRACTRGPPTRHHGRCRRLINAHARRPAPGKLPREAATPGFWFISFRSA
jgi:hypothetical protein